MSKKMPWAAYPVRTTRASHRRGKVHAVYYKADRRPLCGIGEVEVPAYLRDANRSGLFSQSSPDLRCTKCSTIVNNNAKEAA
jgi:hypothetical protein